VALNRHEAPTASQATGPTGFVHNAACKRCDGLAIGKFSNGSVLHDAGRPRHLAGPCPSAAGVVVNTQRRVLATRENDPNNFTRSRLKRRQGERVALLHNARAVHQIEVLAWNVWARILARQAVVPQPIAIIFVLHGARIVHATRADGDTGACFLAGLALVPIKDWILVALGLRRHPAVLAAVATSACWRIAGAIPALNLIAGHLDMPVAAEIIARGRECHDADSSTHTTRAHITAVHRQVTWHWQKSATNDSTQVLSVGKTFACDTTLWTITRVPRTGSAEECTICSSAGINRDDLA
jgi:hypothetical protein